jgi:hypothetical protein
MIGFSETDEISKSCLRKQRNVKTKAFLKFMNHSESRINPSKGVEGVLYGGKYS